MNIIELKPTRTEHFCQYGHIDFLDFCIDGVPLRRKLSYSKYDEMVAKEPSTNLERMTKESHELYGHLPVKKGEPTPRCSEITLQARLKYEPSRFCKGSNENQWDAMQELLLRANPPITQRRCRLYGCYNCPCLALTAVFEIVDDCFVWHSFLDEYRWQSTAVELGGGPFFFARENYISALEGVMDHSW
ncbi:MAG TPA: hypothetical protein VFE51_18870 [Verrucomicrobiae bacterium]|nr:hypothetical protein [Verrucomicrobiae bacterium]